jgi:hypothetical protein
MIDRSDGNHDVETAAAAAVRKDFAEGERLG